MGEAWGGRQRAPPSLSFSRQIKFAHLNFRAMAIFEKSEIEAFIDLTCSFTGVFPL